MNQEQERYNFILERDGEEKALAFAVQAHNCYRQAVLQSKKRGRKIHHGSLPEYNRQFIESYIFYKRLLFSN